MLTSTTLKDRPREVLAATGLPHEACARVLPACAAASAALSPPDKTFAGTVRQRQVGGGATGVWLQPADTVLFLLGEQQTHPLHTLHGVPCTRRQPQPNSWRQHWRPVLQRAFADLARAPAHDASPIAPSPLMLAGAPHVALDGTERRRQRPQDAALHKAHASGKKQAPTEKHLLLVHERSLSGADQRWHNARQKSRR